MGDMGDLRGRSVEDLQQATISLAGVLDSVRTGIILEPGMLCRDHR